MTKKAQSALEFLMTYGWAFLITVLVIVALYMLGVIDFLNWIPDYCKFDSNEISCNAFVLDATTQDQSKDPSDEGHVLLKLTNEFGEPVVIKDCKAYVEQRRFCTDEVDDTKTTFIAKDDSYINCTNTVWPENKALNLRLEGCEFESNSLKPTKKRKVEVELTYYPRRHGEAFTKTIRGEVFTMIDE